MEYFAELNNYSNKYHDVLNLNIANIENAKTKLSNELEKYADNIRLLNEVEDSDKIKENIEKNIAMTLRIKMNIIEYIYNILNPILFFRKIRAPRFRINIDDLYDNAFNNIYLIVNSFKSDILSNKINEEIKIEMSNVSILINIVENLKRIRDHEYDMYTTLVKDIPEMEIVFDAMMGTGTVENGGTIYYNRNLENHFETCNINEEELYYKNLRKCPHLYTEFHFDKFGEIIANKLEKIINYKNNSEYTYRLYDPLLYMDYFIYTNDTVKSLRSQKKLQVYAYNSSNSIPNYIRKDIDFAAIGDENKVFVTGESFDFLNIKLVEDSVDSFNKNNKTSQQQKELKTGTRSHTILMKAMKALKDNGIAFITVPEYIIDKELINSIIKHGKVEDIYYNVHKTGINFYLFVLQKDKSMAKNLIELNKQYNYISEIVYVNKMNTLNVFLKMNSLTGNIYLDEINKLNITLTSKGDNGLSNINISYKGVSEYYELKRNNEEYDKFLNFMNKFLDSKASPVVNFKGTSPDLYVVKGIFDRSDAYLKASNAVSEDSKYDNSPLLPFNSGQIGQVLVSGRLNGIINEENSGHVIKGTVISSTINKEPEYEIKEDESRYPNTVITTLKEVSYTSNSVVINCFMANGEYKQIKAVS